jgi:hypothetical protein
MPTINQLIRKQRHGLTARNKVPDLGGPETATRKPEVDADH